MDNGNTEALARRATQKTLICVALRAMTHFGCFPGTDVPGNSCVALRAVEKRNFKKRKRGMEIVFVIPRSRVGFPKNHASPSSQRNVA